MDLALLTELKNCKSASVLTSHLAGLVDEGLLVAGEVLPSTRELAGFLETSRSTVARAFQQMEARGYFIARQGQGTIVNSLPALSTIDFSPAASRKVDWSHRYTARAESLIALEKACKSDCQISGKLVDTDLLPIAAWKSKLATLAADKETGRRLKQGSAALGFLPLREAVSGLLSRTRGTFCPASRIVLYSSAEIALRHICMLVVRPTDNVLCESMSLPNCSDAFSTTGAGITAAQVDREGLKIDALQAERLPNWIYLTHAGASLSNDRVRRLYEYLREREIAIIEDTDFAELPFDASPVSMLCSREAPEAHILLYNFKQLLYPLCNLCCLILPEPLVPLFERSKEIFDYRTARLEDLTLAELIADGTLERHRYSACKELRHRKRSLIVDLLGLFKQQIRIIDRNETFALIVRFNKSWTEKEILDSAQSAGLALHSSSQTPSNGDSHSSEASRNEFSISFANMAAGELGNRTAKFARILLFDSATQIAAEDDHLPTRNNLIPGSR